MTTTNDIDASVAYQRALKEFTAPTEVEQLRAELEKAQEGRKLAIEMHDASSRAHLDTLRELEKVRAQLTDANRANAGIRAMCEAYKDQPPPIFQGPNLSEHGRGYNAGTQHMARAVLDAIDGLPAEAGVAR